jgi:hypothetical protein
VVREYLLGVGVYKGLAALVASFATFFFLKELRKAGLFLSLEVFLAFHELALVAGGDGLPTVCLVQGVLELLAQATIVLHLFFHARKFLLSRLPLPPGLVRKRLVFRWFALLLLQKWEKGHLNLRVLPTLHRQGSFLILEGNLQRFVALGLGRFGMLVK